MLISILLSAIAAVVVQNTPAPGGSALPNCCAMRYGYIIAPLPAPGVFEPIYNPSTFLTLSAMASNDPNLSEVQASAPLLNDVVFYDKAGREAGFASSSKSYDVTIGYPNSEGIAANANLIISIGKQQVAFMQTRTEDPNTHAVTEAGEIHLVDSPKIRVTFEETLDRGIVVKALFRSYLDYERGRLSFIFNRASPDSKIRFPTVYFACLASRQFAYSKEIKQNPQPCFPTR